MGMMNVHVLFWILGSLVAVLEKFDEAGFILGCQNWDRYDIKSLLKLVKSCILVRINYGSHDGVISGCSCSCPLTGGLISSICMHELPCITVNSVYMFVHVCSSSSYLWSHQIPPSPPHTPPGPPQHDLLSCAEQLGQELGARMEELEETVQAKTCSTHCSGHLLCVPVGLLVYVPVGSLLRLFSLPLYTHAELSKCSGTVRTVINTICNIQ